MDLSNSDKDLIQKFEEMLAEEKTFFFDLSDFEVIANHYYDLGNFKKTLKTVEYALHIYPFSDSIQLIKAQVFIEQNKYNEAMEIINSLPDINNPEVCITKSIILIKN